MKINIGDKIYLPKEKRPYRVQARNDRYIICTMPYNPKKTVMYFIIDLVRNVRGTDNLIFCHGYETKEECENALRWLEKGAMEVSCRNFVALDIEVE